MQIMLIEEVQDILRHLYVRKDKLLKIYRRTDRYNLMLIAKFTNSDPVYTEFRLRSYLLTSTEPLVVLWEE